VEKEQLGAAETSFSDPPFQNSSSSLEKLLGWVHNSRAGMSSLPPRSPQQEDPPALWLPTEPTKSVSRDWDPMCLEVGILRGGGARSVTATVVTREGCGVTGPSSGDM
jgi:hypothetical protein